MTRRSWLRSWILCIVIAPGLVASPESIEEWAGDDLAVVRALPEGWYARIETDAGRIVVRLLPDQAPRSVAYFAALAEGRLPWTDSITGERYEGRYYDGVVVTRAEAGFFFFAGGRPARGVGPPRLYVPPGDGFGRVNFGNTEAAIGMGTEPGGAKSGVQFFVTASVQPWLSAESPCFGKVVLGKETAFNISQIRTGADGEPFEPLTVDRIRIFSIGSPPPLPEPEPYQPERKKIEFRPRSPKR